MSGLPCMAAMMRGVVWSLSDTFTSQLLTLSNICQKIPDDMGLGIYIKTTYLV